MTYFAELTDTPRRRTDRVQSFTDFLGSSSWTEAEETENLPELSKEQTWNLRPTTDIPPVDLRYYSWSHLHVIQRHLAQSLHFFLRARKEDLSPDESWYENFVTGEPREHQQPTHTRWIRNLRHSHYQLRRDIPIVVERDGQTVTAHYDDLNLTSESDDLQSAISGLCEEIVAYYEEAHKSADLETNLPTQEQAFLKQIIGEIQPKVWDEIKQIYAEKLKAFPYVDKGYINISAPDYADVIIVLSDESADRIAQLAEIDLEINLKFRPLYFYVEYESSEEYLDLKNFVRFY